MIKLSDRANSIQPSPTMSLNAKAAELKRQGKDILNLTVGEPDFDTPDHIKQAAIHAIKKGETKYTAVDGIPTLKKAIQEKFKKENHLNYDENQIIVSDGAKHSLYNICQAVLNPGDEVIIPAPYWVTYPAMVQLAEATPVFINTNIQSHYKITPEQLEKAITAKTRFIILNSPSNPTGIHYTPEELKALAKVLLNHPKLLIVSDDIYEHILWHGQFKNIVNVCPKLYERTMVVNGVSKSYSMTGWRIGYVAGPENIVGAMKKIQSQSTSNPCSISQAAALEALTGTQSSIPKMVKAFKKRHDLVIELLQKIDGIRVVPSGGTFYCFPDIQHLIDDFGGINNDIEFAEYILRDANVAIVPGSSFGHPGSFRLSFAADLKTLKTAIQRIKIAIDQA